MMQVKSRFCALTGICLASLMIAPVEAAIWYVDDDGPVGGSGLSWSDAFTALQSALAVSNPGDEIRVAEGVYRPDQTADGSIVPGDRDASFVLVDGVVLLGGFRGCPGGDCSGDPNEYDLSLYESILTGDLLGNDDPNANDLNHLSLSDNSIHVVNASGVSETAQLTGFTITAGNANLMVEGPDAGGGLRCDNGRPAIRRCVFEGNWGYYGAGVDFNFGSVVQVEQCVFLRNSARYEGGAVGIGTSDEEQETVISFIECDFFENSAFDAGGAARTVLSGARARFHRCNFIMNAVEVPGFRPLGYGGALASREQGSLYVNECNFIGNRSGFGVGIGMQNGDELHIRSSVFAGNQAARFAVIFVSGGPGNSATCPIENSVFVGNWSPVSGGLIVGSRPILVSGCTIVANEIDRLFPSSVELTISNSVILGDSVAADWNADISYSIIEGGAPGVGNIATPPIFLASPDDGGDGWTDDPNTPGIDESANDDYGDLRLSLFSPGIDAGTNVDPIRDWYDLDGDGCLTEVAEFDVAGQPRYQDQPFIADCGFGLEPLIDIGAYEVSGYTYGDCGCGGDIDQDGFIEGFDGLLMLDCQMGPDWAALIGCECSDLDMDADVDMRDVSQIQQWMGL
jgi:hypothetical protein